MDEFNQLCVWQGVTLEGSAPEELEKYFKENLDVTVKFSAEKKRVGGLTSCSISLTMTF